MVYGICLCQTLKATPGKAWHVCQVFTENAVATACPEPGFVHPGHITVHSQGIAEMLLQWKLLTKLRELLFWGSYSFQQA